MDKRAYLVLILAAIAVLPFASANGIGFPRYNAIFILGLPWILIIPLAIDAIALKIGLLVTKTKLENKRFLILLLALWLIGYLTDVLALLVGSVASYSGTLVMVLALTFFLYIFIFDSIVLARFFKIECKLGLLISLAVIAFFLNILAILILLVIIYLLRHNKKVLAIAAIMAILTNMLILVFILPPPPGGYFGSMFDAVGGITCASNSIDEMVTKIKKAESGIITSTGIICMYTDESYTVTSLINKVTNLNNLTFKCDGAAVCKNNRPIDVSDPNLLVATADAQFKGIVACIESSGKYDCTITIKSA